MATAGLSTAGKRCPTGAVRLTARSVLSHKALSGHSHTHPLRTAHGCTKADVYHLGRSKRSASTPALQASESSGAPVKLPSHIQGWAAFLASPQEMLILPIQGPHPENPYCKDTPLSTAKRKRISQVKKLHPHRC